MQYNVSKTFVGGPIHYELVPDEQPRVREKLSGLQTHRGNSHVVEDEHHESDEKESMGPSVRTWLTCSAPIISCFSKELD